MFKGVEKFVTELSNTIVLGNLYEIYIYFYTTITFIAIVFFAVARLIEDGVMAAKRGEYDYKEFFITLIFVLMAISLATSLLYFLIGFTRDIVGIFSDGDQSAVITEIRNDLKEITEKNEQSWLSKVGGFLFEAATYYAYQVIKILTLFGNGFITFAMAVVWLTAIILTPIAIASSLSRKLSVLRGWGLLIAGVILWEFLTAVFQWVLNVSFSNIKYDSISAEMTSDDMYMILALYQLLSFGAAVAAMLFSFKFVANQVSGVGLASPFVVAGTAFGLYLANKVSDFNSLFSKPSSKTRRSSPSSSSKTSTSGTPSSPSSPSKTSKSPTPSSPPSNKGTTDPSRTVSPADHMSENPTRRNDHTEILSNQPPQPKKRD